MEPEQVQQGVAVLQVPENAARGGRGDLQERGRHHDSVASGPVGRPLNVHDLYLDMGTLALREESLEIRDGDGGVGRITGHEEPEG